MVVVGNGGLNSKSVVGALCLVLSWKVTYRSAGDEKNEAMIDIASSPGSLLESLRLTPVT